MAANLPHEYNLVVKQAQQECITQQASEQKNWGTTHAELGACLLCMSGLPIGIIEAVAYHHFPSRSSQKSFCPLAAVHVANIFEHELNSGDPKSGKLDLDYLSETGLAEHLITWSQLCRGLS